MLAAPNSSDYTNRTADLPDPGGREWSKRRSRMQDMNELADLLDQALRERDHRKFGMLIQRMLKQLNADKDQRAGEPKQSVREPRK